MRKGQGNASVTSRGRKGLVGCVREGAVCVGVECGMEHVGFVCTGTLE